MATCRSIDRQPLAPLVDLLRGFAKRDIQCVMLKVMPIITAPSLRKDQLIDQLADYVRSYGSLADVCKLSVKGLRKDYLHMLLRQYDAKESSRMPKSAMIDKFIHLSMPHKSLRDNGPCMAIVPYVDNRSADVRTADFPGQPLGSDDNARKIKAY